MTPAEFCPRALKPGRFHVLTDGFCELSETESGAILKKVKILGAQAGDILLKTDMIRGLDSFFQSGSGLRHSDYLLLTKLNEKKRAVFFELKSRSFRQNSYVEQFKGSECLADLLDSIGGRFHGAEELIREYTKHFVVLHKLPISKATPAFVMPPPNRSPQAALEFYVDEINTVDLREVVID